MQQQVRSYEVATAHMVSTDCFWVQFEGTGVVRADNMPCDDLPQSMPFGVGTGKDRYHKQSPIVHAQLDV